MPRTKGVYSGRCRRTGNRTGIGEWSSSMVVGCGGVIVVLAGVLTSCEADDPSSDVIVDVREISEDAVEVLANPEELTAVQDLEVAPGGGFWVLNREPPFFLRLDDNGEILIAEGHRGEGPDEFGVPVGLIDIESDDPEVAGVWTYDAGRRSLARVADGSGESVRGQVIDLDASEIEPTSLLAEGVSGFGRHLWATHLWMRPGRDAVLFAVSGDDEPIGPAFWRAEIKAVSLRDGTVAERVNTEEVFPDPSAHYPGATEFLPAPLWTPCPGGNLWMYDPVENVVRGSRVMDDGEISWGTPVPLPPKKEEPFSPDAMFEMVLPLLLEEVPEHQRPPEEQLRMAFDQEFQTVEGGMAEVFPEYYTMRCGSTETLWLQEFDAREGYGGRGWQWVQVQLESGVGDPEPRVTRVTQVRFPEKVLPLRFDADEAWGVARDELGVASVVRISLD